jgi:sortase A
VDLRQSDACASLLERAFTETLATGQPVKPWSWAGHLAGGARRGAAAQQERDRAPQQQRAGARLRTGPRGADAARLARNGTAIYAAHRETHFAFLGEVVVGDEIKVTRRDGAVHRFHVHGTSIVHWNASGIDPLSRGRNLVLATCWPLDGKVPGPLRYLVHAD